MRLKLETEVGLLLKIVLSKDQVMWIKFLKGGRRLGAEVGVLSKGHVMWIKFLKGGRILGAEVGVGGEG